MTNREILQINRLLNKLFFKSQQKTETNKDLYNISYMKYKATIELLEYLNYRVERLTYQGCVTHLITKI